MKETHLLNVDAGRLASKFYHTTAFFSANSKSKGVAIVARRNLQIKVLTSWADNMGRIVITRIESRLSQYMLEKTVLSTTQSRQKCYS